MRLQELLGCLWHNIAELAGIVRDDRHHRINHLLGIESGFLMSYACVKKLQDIRSLDEVLAVVLPMKGGLGHRLVETRQVSPRIDGLYLDIEWLQFYLKRLSDAFQSMLARAIGSKTHDRE